MMLNRIDLHVHSNASDGSFRPSELVHMAISKNLKAFALTDHDTVDGIEEALHEAKKVNDSYDITVIPGIELSAEYKGGDIHILGLNIDYKNQDFLNEINEFRRTRDARNEKMIALMQENGFDITKEKIDEYFGDEAVITRAHYAILMVEGGYVKDKDEAFNKYLNPGCSCYVPRTKVSAVGAVKLILKAGGKPVLAHPILYKHLSENDLEELIALLKAEGLVGLEAIYCLNKDGDKERLTELANKYNLFITGGSDFHGKAKPGLEMGTGYGNLFVPADLLKNII